jgi:hypothetical protein
VHRNVAYRDRENREFMIRAILVVASLAPVLLSQIVGGIVQFPPQLKQYMSLRCTSRLHP